MKMNGRNSNVFRPVVVVCHTLNSNFKVRPISFFAFLRVFSAFIEMRNEKWVINAFDYYLWGQCQHLIIKYLAVAPSHADRENAISHRAVCNIYTKLQCSLHGHICSGVFVTVFFMFKKKKKCSEILDHSKHAHRTMT